MFSTVAVAAGALITFSVATGYAAYMAKQLCIRLDDLDISKDCQDNRL